MCCVDLSTGLIFRYASAEMLIEQYKYYAHSLDYIWAFCENLEKEEMIAKTSKTSSPGNTENHI